MEFEDRIYSMVRNLVEYKMYKGSSENALKLLRKHHPEKSKEECEAIFNLACESYRDALVLVNSNAEYYSLENPSYVLEAETAYRKKYEQLSDRLLTAFIGWVYHWHYER